MINTNDVCPRCGGKRVPDPDVSTGHIEHTKECEEQFWKDHPTPKLLRDLMGPGQRDGGGE